MERYGAPTWLRHCLLSLHGGAVLRGTNAALTLPAVIARGRGTGHQRCFDIACRHRTGAQYWAPTWLRHSQPSSHGGAVRGTNVASTSPAVVARGRSTGHQRGFVIASRRRTVKWYYGAPTRLRHHPLSSHGGAVLGTNAASTSPTVVARWSGTMGHQCGFAITCSRHTVGRYYGAPTRL